MSKIKKLRYLTEKQKFLGFAFDVCQEYFDNVKDFDAFFNSIDSDDRKDKFLKIVSYYKFLIRDGKFYNEDPKFDKYIDCLDETYKYIALISLIESIYNQNEYKEFYEWIKMNPESVPFPITHLSDLEGYYEAYKKEHGVTQKVGKFFCSLDDQCKNIIKTKLKVKGKNDFLPLANYFYKIRSEFVHNANLVLQFGKETTIAGDNAEIVSDLNLQDLKMFFEHGLLKHFGYCREFKHPISATRRKYARLL